MQQQTVYNTLVVKFKLIDTRGFVLKTKYNTDKLGIEKKISDASNKLSVTSRLVYKTGDNAKIQ